MDSNQIPEFGIKRADEERRDGGCGIVFDPTTKKYAVGVQENGRLRLFSGGVEEGEDIKVGILREVEEESGLYDFEYVEKVAQAWAHYHNSLKNINRVALATCYLIVLKSTKLKPVKLESHEKFSLGWAAEREMLNNWQEWNQDKDVDHWFYFFDKATQRIKELRIDK